MFLHIAHKLNNTYMQTNPNKYAAPGHSKRKFGCVQAKLIRECDGQPARYAVPKSTQSNVAY